MNQSGIAAAALCAAKCLAFLFTLALVSVLAYFTYGGGIALAVPCYFALFMLIAVYLGQDSRRAEAFALAGLRLLLLWQLLATGVLIRSRLVAEHVLVRLQQYEAAHGGEQPETLEEMNVSIAWANVRYLSGYIYFWSGNRGAPHLFSSDGKWEYYDD